jgi:hypothetical protein
MTGAEAAAAEGFLTVYALAEDGPVVTAKLLTLLPRVSIGGKQVHDANIVATMLAHGIPPPAHLQRRRLSPLRQLDRARHAMMSIHDQPCCR